jgi:bacillaene synthase trans-acting acyltransferase
MFSGQGSQYYHMGKELYCRNSIFRHWMSKINNIIYENVGISITDEIYNESPNKYDKFDNILYTHPAIFMVEYSLARVLIESGVEPDYVLGASLGEVTSAAVAGIISVEETIECILKRVELLENYCEFGSMIAIIQKAELYHQVPSISLFSELAAVNYGSHFVISGECENLLKIEKYLANKNIIFQTLPVRYGFHSSNIESIEGEYKKFLSKLSFERSKIPVISCLLSDYVTEVSPEYFWDVSRRTIHFQKTILMLEKDAQFNYIDLGPSGTLANFVKYNLQGESLSQIYDVLSPHGQDVKKLENVKEIFKRTNLHI